MNVGAGGRRGWGWGGEMGFEVPLPGGDFISVGAVHGAKSAREDGLCLRDAVEMDPQPSGPSCPPPPALDTHTYSQGCDALIHTHTHTKGAAAMLP